MPRYILYIMNTTIVLFFFYHLYSHLEPLMSLDWRSPTLIVHEHVLCWSVKGSRESVTDVESSNTPPSVMQWLMFKEWAKNLWPAHPTARGTLLPYSPQYKSDIFRDMK